MADNDKKVGETATYPWSTQAAWQRKGASSVAAIGAESTRFCAFVESNVGSIPLGALHPAKIKRSNSSCEG
jgi:hypothetical protein